MSTTNSIHERICDQEKIRWRNYWWVSCEFAARFAAGRADEDGGE